jgi:glycine/D-amino acid oxidase-like deaminating enzyme/nitrite reductase/ring-hydroxylating ferredoxin subunit
MDTLSVWRASAPDARYSPLQGDASTDVLVIGGGITGLSLAFLVAQQGRSVMVLEAETVGSGTTGNSTGNLYETLSQGLSGITRRWDDTVAREVLAQRRAAVAWIQERARGSGSGFTRCNLHLYATTAEEVDSVSQEHIALAKAGAPVSMAREVSAPLPPPVGDVLVLADQAQVQPQAYVNHLAAEAMRADARLHEHSRVLELDRKARRAVTSSGTVQAHEIVLATHSPKGFHLVQAEMPVHREYGIARPLAGADPGAGIFWIRGAEHYSVRTFATGAQRFLVCVGQEHKTGVHNAKASLMALEAGVARLFGTADVAFRWSAQNYRSADGLPYIGRDPSGCFIATGFATDGLVWGTVSAHVIAAQLAGREAPLGELCRPGRFSPVKGARGMLEEVGITVKSLVKDYLTHRQEQKLASLSPGDSAILDVDGTSIAAWRAPDGELFAVSSVCTHMGCKVHWNSVETSWDCPCHGSRFKPDGTVIEGPALAPLARKHVNVG